MAIEITYNDYTIDEDMITGAYRRIDSYEAVQVSVKFRILADSQANLETACKAAEVALQEWDKDLVLGLGGSDETFSHSLNTGYLARPSLTKIDDELSAETSRHYEFAVRVETPADATDMGGRRSGSISVSWDESGRRTFRFEGEYTAIAGPPAIDAATAATVNGALWATSILNGFTGVSFRTVSRTVTNEHKYKKATFSQVSAEQISAVVVYNGKTFPGTVDRVMVDETYESATVTVLFTVNHDDAAAGVGTWTDIEADLTKWNKDLTVSHDASSWLSFSHSANTGMLGRPSLRKLSAEADESFTRVYEWTCSFTRPANEASFGGRRNAQIQLSKDESNRQTISFTAEYTGTAGSPASGAYANATTNGATWIDSVFTGLGLTKANFDRLKFDVSYEHEDKRATLTAAYIEMIEPEGNGGAVDGIINASVSYESEIPTRIGTAAPVDGQTLLSVSSGGGGAGFAGPPRVVTIRFSARVDVESLATPQAVTAAYVGTVRPYLISRFRGVLGRPETLIVIQSESYSASPSTSSIQGSVSIMAAREGWYIRYSEAWERRIDPGITYEKLWDGEDDTYAEWGVGSSTLGTFSYSLEILSKKNPGEPSVSVPSGWRPVSLAPKVGPHEFVGQSGNDATIWRYSGTLVIRKVTGSRWNGSYSSPRQQPTTGRGSDGETRLAIDASGDVRLLTPGVSDR